MWNDKQRPQSGNPTAANRGRIMTILVSPFPQNGPRERERVADDDLKWRNGDRKTVGIISRSAGCHCRPINRFCLDPLVLAAPRYSDERHYEFQVLWLVRVHDVALPSFFGSQELKSKILILPARRVIETIETPHRVDWNWPRCQTGADSQGREGERGRLSTPLSSSPLPLHRAVF